MDQLRSGEKRHPNLQAFSHAMAFRDKHELLQHQISLMRAPYEYNINLFIIR